MEGHDFPRSAAWTECLLLLYSYVEALSSYKTVLLEVGTLILNVAVSRTVKNESLLSNHSPGILLSQPEPTKTPMKGIVPQIAANPKQNTYKENNTVPKKPTTFKAAIGGKKREIIFKGEIKELRTDLSTEMLEDSTHTFIIRENEYQMEFYKCPLK